MSEWGDWEHDAMMDEMFESISNEAINDFKNETQIAYYWSHKDLLIPAMNTFKSAKELMNASFFTAFTTSIEIFLKTGILKPIVYGMIHNELTAKIITDLFLSHTGILRYKKALIELCKATVKLNLEEISGTQEGIKLINEIEPIQKIRNKIVHQGYIVNEEEHARVFNVASKILDEIVVPVLNGIKYKLDDNGRINIMAYST